MFSFLLLGLSACIALATSDFAKILKRQGCSDQGQCNSGIAACVNYICTDCADVSPVISQCCAGSDDVAKLTCLEKGLEGGLGDSGASSSQLGPDTTSAQGLTIPTRSTSTLPTALTNDPNFVACDNFQTMLDRCSSQTPGFSTLTAFSDEAPCLCYSSQTYQGSLFDGYFSSCLYYFSTADPAGYSSIAASTGGPVTSKPCAAAASGVSVPVTPTATGVRSTNTPAVGGGGFLTHPAASSQPTPSTTSNPTQPEASNTATVTGGDSGESNKRVNLAWTFAWVFLVCLTLRGRLA